MTKPIPLFFFLAVAILGLPSLDVSAQLSSCFNADFEQNNFNGWQGTTGTCCPINSTTPGIVAGRHTIMTGAGTDPNTNNLLTVVAPGGLFSARLGNDQIGAEAEQLIYSFPVGVGNELFIYKYAVVLEDPFHVAADQPRFEIRVFDQNGDSIGCGSYNVYSTAGIPGFQTVTGPFGTPINWKDWTTVGIDLTPYIGQTVTIEFSTGDCAQTGHFGYAYVDCYCSPLVVSSDYCNGDSSTILSAPVGFESYLWSTGETTASINVSSPVIGDTFSVVLTAVSGCQITLYKVIARTVITAAMMQTDSCFNSLSFLDSSYVVAGTPISSWNWNFGDGNTSTLPNPVHAYSSPGNYSVTLIATNQGGCSDTVVQNINAIDVPIAHFNYTTACPGFPLLFSDNSISTSPLTGWTWNFGDFSAGDTLQNTSHIYSFPGNYNVTLIATDGNGCRDTVTGNVSTVPAPVAGFTFASACLSNDVTFTDTTVSTGSVVVSWLWDFGDGDTSTLQHPVHTYPSPGNYSVTLIAVTASGCSDTTTQSLSLLNLPIAGFFHSLACSKQDVLFSDTSSLSGGLITAWSWDFDDGGTSLLQNPLHVYTTPGNYNVELTVTGNNGCTDSLAQLVVVESVPQALFNTSAVCPGNPAQFNDASVFASGTITGWQWDFGDFSGLDTLQNPTHQYNFQGAYTVTLVVSGDNGCTDSVVQLVNTTVAPVAIFVIPSGCPGLPVNFINQTTISSGGVSGYTWYFGDGTSSTVLHPWHTFPSAGSYFVSLVAVSTTGCKDSVAREVVILDPPVANFNNIPACINQQTSFFDLTPAIPVPITSWQWNFGDGSPIEFLQNPIHTFTADSNSIVSLIVTDANGCIDTIQKPVFIPALPVPSFIALAPVCVGTAVQFSNTGYIPGGASAYQWNFNDSSAVSTSANPQHTFANAGTYPVTNVITTTNGCVDSITQNVIINPLPVANFTSGDVCLGQVSSFTDNSSLAGGTITSWQWNFGDTTPNDTTENPLHNYNSAATYNVTLTATGSNGCTHTIVNPTTVFQLPVADFAAVSVCEGSPIFFTDISDSGGVALTNWTWNFNDGSSVNNLQNPVHIYLDSGNYSVQLIVVNTNNCIDTTQANVYIKPIPDADFVTSVLCQDSLVIFSDSSSLAGGSISNWFWNFGDGNSSAIQNPTHLYSVAGNVNVQLAVAGTNGCSDTLNSSLYINPLPVANFNFTNVCEYEVLHLTDVSTLSNGAITNWHWNFGDGITDTIQDPDHMYGSPGNYNINLVVTGSTNCKNDTLMTATIFPQPNSDFTIGPACEQNPVSFLDNSTVASGTVTAWSWNFGDGSALSNLQNTQHSFSNDTSYTITLIAYSDSGCVDTSLQTVSIHPLPIPAFSADTVCYGVETSFANASSVVSGSLQQYYWSFGDNGISVAYNPDYIYTGSGVFTAQLIVVTDWGCMDSVQHDVKVYELPDPDFVADITSGCQPLLVSFEDLSVSQEGIINHWYWNFGDGNSSTDSVTWNLYLSDGVFEVSLLVATDLGCVDSITKPAYITVYPQPIAGFDYSPEQPSLLHPNVQFEDQSSGANNWFYSFGDNSYSTEAYPQHNYATPGLYNVMQIVTTGFGCKDTAYEIIEVENVYTLYIPNAFTPNNDGNNDNFSALGIGITEFAMTIFNRWGQPVFKSGSIEESWNGFYNDKPAKEDVYYYHIKVKDVFDKPHFINGSVSVVY